MSNDLHLQATRDIVVKGKNIKEQQSYYIGLIQIKESQGASEIANSKNPFKAYCEYLRKVEKEYEWEEEPIYLWDVDKSKEAYKILISCACDFEELDKHIIGYEKTSVRLIKSLEEEIKEALINGYKLNWEVW
jgi:hypothetical protein